MSTIPNNMTIEEFAERYNKRQSILKSQIAAENAKFSVAEAIRHLSDYRAGNVVTESSAKTLLEGMVIDGMLVKERANSKTRYSVPRPKGEMLMVTGDNGVRIGLHQPPSPAVLRGEAEYVNGPAYLQ